MKLEQKFQAEVDALKPTLMEFPWENKQVYGAWLRQTVGLVRHTTRFICLAAANTPMEEREAHYEWIHHLKGELNHDLVALKDLENLKLTEASIPLMWPAEQIVQNQYYWLQNHNPSSLLGYALLLEGLACHVAPGILEKMAPHYSKSETAFLRLHANVDQDHYAEGLEFLAKIAPDTRQLIEENLVQSARLYNDMLAEAAKWARIQNKKAA